MVEGVIELPEGELDLKLSMECGQTFVWNKWSGKPLYEDTSCRKFYKVHGEDLVLLWQEGTDLYYRGTMEEEEIYNLLNLDVSMEELEEELSRDEIIEEAFEDFRGLRILNDEFFPTLISYIISAQMQIPRIKRMVNRIAEKWGSTVAYENQEFNRFPTPEELAQASEEELRDLGMGYRASYVKETTEQVLDGEVDPSKVRDMSYPEAQEELKKLTGVGDKVADCVLLFSLGFHDSYPLDTWGKKVIGEVYPEFEDSRYWKVAEDMREYFGEYAGWAHEYLFHWGRENREIL
ncbi:MAG: 8-oxoguanine DNA glycosylase [Candidatus Nanohaloarchaeota archaeon QJJ-9]|nr:8-oxoguanine DNA glycosylase [Candidatus Nanohaloarchaeota archaeon QJJ-9]